MFELFLAELRRSWIQFTRYSTEAIAGVIVTTALFYGLFVSARYIAGPSLQFGNRLEAIVVGYVLGILVLFIMADIAGTLQNEAQTGTLEQLFLSPFNAPQLFLMRALASLTLQLTLIFSILLIIVTLTRSQLAFPPSLLLPLLTVLLGAYGLAFAMGSLTLLLKRVQQLLGIFQFALLFLLTVPAETKAGSVSVLRLLLPMVPGAGILRDLMARGQALNFGQLALAFGNGVVYFTLGLLLFGWAEREAKRRGRLSGY